MGGNTHAIYVNHESLFYCVRKVKLVDFGCSCGHGLGFEASLDKGEGMNGTPAYWPPELVESEDEGIPYSFNTAADMW